MKKILTATLSLLCMLPMFAQQKLSLFGIASNWDTSKTYSFAGAGREHAFDGMVMSFAQEYAANPMMHALLAQFTGDADQAGVPVAEFKLDEQNCYVRLRLKTKEFAEVEARFWPLPGGRGWFVIKMVNLDEDTLPRIYFLRVDLSEGVMKPAPEPDGMNYGFAENFVLPGSGDSIEVTNEMYPSDHIVLQGDGSFIYVNSVVNAIAAYVSDPDPSGLTNIRATPGGKVIGRIGDPANHDEAEADDGNPVLVVYNPTNGWWQILDRIVDGIRIEGQAWIHYSVLKMHTRNYGGEALRLYESPDESSKVVCRIREQAADVCPMDVSGDGEWVKVRGKAGTGWIQASWLCANPLTTCP